jgi:hypothetical protein
LEIQLFSDEEKGGNFIDFNLEISGCGCSEISFIMGLSHKYETPSALATWIHASLFILFFWKRCFVI